MQEPPLPSSSSEPNCNLGQISTCWATVNRPLQFLMRYAPAIRKYLDALMKNRHDAEEVAQDFLLRASTVGFRHADPARGRFRDYLKAAVRHAALDFLRRKRTAPLSDAVLPQLAAPDENQNWLAEWRQCILEGAWRALESHQRQSPGNLFYTVLRLSADYPEEDSKALAARTAEQIARPISAEAFRKQFSRARRKFAELLVEEIARTVEDPNQVENELIEVGLMKYVRDFLPEDWAGHSGKTE